MSDRTTCAPAARAKHAARPSALEVFIARGEARALLWAACEFDLHEAVDKLQADAERDGLIAQLGQDAVQRLMAAAFAAERDDLLKSEDMVPAELIEPPPVARGAAASTLMAAEFLVREGNAARLRNWLNRHSAKERAAIQKHLEAKRCRSHPSR